MTRPTTTGWMAAGLLMAAALPAWGQSHATRKDPKMLAAFREVVARASESTVRVMVRGKPAALGTIVTPDGYIVTKGSLLKGKLEVTFKSGKSYPATYVALEPKFDLALIKVESGRILTPIEWRDSRTARVGDWVAAAGPGEVPVAVGVVGVATRKPDRFDFLRDPPPAGSGFMGVILRDRDGPAVDSVEPSGPAATAGLKPGDKVLSVDGKPVADMMDLIERIQSFKAGVTVTLRVKRGDGKNETEIKVKLGKRPASPEGADRGDFQNRMGSELSKKRSGFPEIFQTDIVIKPSDCGGPAVDLDGKAVGVNIARGGRTESYAIPSEAVVALLPQLQSGKMPAPFKEAEKAVADAEKAVVEAEKAVDEARKEGDPSKSIGLRKVLVEKRQKLEEAEKALAELRGDPTKP